MYTIFLNFLVFWVEWDFFLDCFRNCQFSARLRAVGGQAEKWRSPFLG